VRFTRQSVAAVSPPPGKPYVIVWDEVLPRFGLRVNQGGSRMWVVQYRASGKTKRETIGRADAINLDDARKRARETLARVHLGSDPHQEKKEAKARASVTFERVAIQYLGKAKPRLRPKPYSETERYLTKHWAALNPIPIHKIQRATVAARLGEIAEESGPFASNRARTALSALFVWAMGEGLADANPIIGTNKASSEVSRDHVMTDAELAAVWRACREDNYGRIVRLLMLTAQRRNEVSAMKWDELDLECRLWSIPKERTKNSRHHDVPLSAPALSILRDAPRRDGRALVFGEGEGGFQAWTMSKMRLDKRIAASGAKIRPWRVHDLRRTAATRMGDLGVMPHVIEAVLNHISGHRAGVAGIYNRAAYANEKRHALDLWASHVQDLVLGTSSNEASPAPVAAET
jgi:integrase